MNFGKAVDTETGIVEACPVPFVFFETVLRIFFSKGAHLTIAGNLGEDRSEGDDGPLLIALDYCFLSCEFLRRLESAVKKHAALARGNL